METDFIFDYFWIVFILVTIVNGLFLKISVRKTVKEKPELKPGYDKFIKGFILIGNIPWLIIGIGILTNTVETMFDFFSPADLNPVVLLFHTSIIGIWIYCFRLVYYENGAEFMEKHPGLIKMNGFSGKKDITARQVKIFFPIALAGGIIGMTMMWFINFPSM